MAGVSGAVHPFGGYGSPFGGIAQVFVLAVVELHGGFRGVAACSVNVHQQLTVKDGQLGMAVIRKVVFEQLVAGSADNLYRAVAFQALLYRAHGADGG